MGYAFISYSSKHKEKAESVRRIFIENGISLWVAPYDIPVGSNYAAEINKAVKNSSCLVLLLTDAAQYSQWIDKELERAVNYKRPIIVLELEKLTLTDSFELYLSNGQWATDIEIDIFNYGFNQAMQSVISLTGTGSIGAKKSAEGKTEKKRTSFAEKEESDAEQHNKAVHDMFQRLTSEVNPEAVPSIITSSYNYIRPVMDLLRDYPKYYDTDISEMERNRAVIIHTLGGLGIECVRIDVTVSAAVIRYEAIIKDEKKVKESVSQSEIIEKALGKGNIVVYFNSDNNSLIIEVPNDIRNVVGLKSVMTSAAYKSGKSLTFALGKKISGEAVCPDISNMPHLLIAGISGSGKTAAVNALIVSLLYKYGPQDLRFIIIDPKKVEYARYYNDLPHLLTREVITDKDKALLALEWAIQEMERRYNLFKDMSENGTNARYIQSVSVRNYKGYNDNLADGIKKLPAIVIVIDEFGELMLHDGKQTESRIVKLTQKARACGIHLVLTTQRTSDECVTELIKCNMPARVCFKVGFADDSQLVLGREGAEKLRGNGDMYYRSFEGKSPIRVQGCLVTDEEIKGVTDYIKANNRTEFDKSFSEFINMTDKKQETVDDDTIFLRALRFCIDIKKASVSIIQRRFPIGYMKSFKILDWMENMNYITKSDGPAPRKVLITLEEFINTYGDIQ